MYNQGGFTYPTFLVHKPNHLTHVCYSLNSNKKSFTIQLTSQSLLCGVPEGLSPLVAPLTRWIAAYWCFCREDDPRLAAEISRVLGV